MLTSDLVSVRRFFFRRRRIAIEGTIQTGPCAFALARVLGHPTDLIDQHVDGALGVFPIGRQQVLVHLWFLSNGSPEAVLCFLLTFGYRGRLTLGARDLARPFHSLEPFRHALAHERFELKPGHC